MNPDGTSWFHTRPRRSVESMLRTADVFAALGDAEAVRQCIRLAERLAVDDGDAHALNRVRAFAERVAASRASEAGTPPAAWLP